MLQIGLKNTLDFKVQENHTARFVQSGGADVLATPVLINLMEKCAWQCVLPYMPENMDTVGTFIEVKHITPTPVGMSVRCICELISINDRELVFQIESFDDVETIAHAMHKRFIIQSEKFQNKVQKKLIIQK